MRHTSVAPDLRTLPVEAARLEPEKAPYLEFRELSKIYATDDGPVRALDGISIGQRKREFLSILGPSGCGKSTLLMIAAGLLPASHGHVSVQGQRIGAPRTDVGIVFQNPVLLEWRKRSATSCCRRKRESSIGPPRSDAPMSFWTRWD